jgi:solute carrier family 9B (sodium/hydrogen exchanger), member 1/2
MALGLALIVLLGLLFSSLFAKLKLPGLLGMLVLGMLMGPYGFSLLDAEILNLSADFRSIALILILLRAGLSISRDTLRKVGGAAIQLSLLPGLLEGFTLALLSIYFLGFTFVEGGILGFIIAAVSPAVIVPQMLKLEEKKLGTHLGIPTLILAGASLDDVVAITLFSAFLGWYTTGQSRIGVELLKIPTSILLGIFLGLLLGLFLVFIFKKYGIRDTKKALLILACAILLQTLEQSIRHIVEIASLMGVMTLGFILYDKIPDLGKRLALKFNKIWIFAELLLFVLVGAQVNIQVAFQGGFIAALMIFVGLLTRSLGVMLATIRTPLRFKERLFCAIAYIPKATVQASIGAIPLSMGVANGDLILAFSVLSILLTAPLGAIGIRVFAPICLVQEHPKS